MFFVMSGIHTFRFERSTLHPGKTLFTNTETPLRLLALLSGPIGMQKAFESFCKVFKARVESVVAGRR